jgi:hypothetical protein
MRLNICAIMSTFGASEEVVNFAYQNSNFVRVGSNFVYVPQQLVVRDNILCLEMPYRFYVRESVPSYICLPDEFLHGLHYEQQLSLVPENLSSCSSLQLQIVIWPTVVRELGCLLGNILIVRDFFEWEIIGTAPLSTFLSRFQRSNRAQRVGACLRSTRRLHDRRIVRV